jgi:hypothetical protein
MAPIIDGGDWLNKRLRHLEAALDASGTDAEREAIQTEIDQLRAAAKVVRRRVRLWWLWGGRPPQT